MPLSNLAVQLNGSFYQTYLAGKHAPEVLIYQDWNFQKAPWKQVSHLLYLKFTFTMMKAMENATLNLPVCSLDDSVFVCFSGRLSRWAHSSIHDNRTAALEHFWNMNMKKSHKETAYNHLKWWYNMYGNVPLQYSRAIFFFVFPFAIVPALFQLSDYCFEWRLLLPSVNECINNFWSSGVKLDWLNVITAVGAQFRFSVRIYFLMINEIWVDFRRLSEPFMVYEE